MSERRRRRRAARMRRRLLAGGLLLAGAIGLGALGLLLVPEEPEIAGRGPPALPGQIFAGPAMVTDGDTLIVAQRTVRLEGIDAPETRQSCTRGGRDWACGVDATRALEGLIGGRSVSCEEVGTDRFGRMLGQCRVAGQDIGAWLVREGWAVAYRRYSDRYVAEEELARANRRGIWAGSFQMPEEWRRANMR